LGQTALRFFKGDGLHACSLRDSAPGVKESKAIITESLRAVYAEVCDELNWLGYRIQTGKW
jgi:hypothetical protein